MELAIANFTVKETQENTIDSDKCNFYSTFVTANSIWKYLIKIKLINFQI